MNILYDNIIFELQKSGGISLYWSELIKRQLQNKDITISFLESHSALTNIFRNTLDIPEHNIIKSNSVLPLGIQRYLPVTNRNNFPVFHSSYYRSITKKSKETVNVVTVHDFIYEHYIKGIKKTIHSWQKRKALMEADGIICISESTKSDLLKIHPELDKKLIKVVYNGVSDAYKPINKNEALPYLEKKYKLSQPFILYVGSRDSSYKNFELAVNNTLNYPLILVGGGNLNHREIHLLQKVLKDKYQHLQYIPEEELNIFYNMAHCLLYPSSHEGFGLPLIEAQKAGCPVIAFNNSSIPEIVRNDSTLINELSDDAIREKIIALENTSYKDAVSKVGLLHSQNFSWDICYQETIDFYEEVSLQLINNKWIK